MSDDSVQGIRGRMAAIKEQVAKDVDAKWGSPWRTEEVFNLKVSSRLAGHAEYLDLRARLKEAEAAEAASDSDQ